MNRLKVALVQDYLKEYGGAERVLEALHEIWPEAPLYTLVYLPQYLGPHRERFKNWDIRASFLRYLPFSGKLISMFRLIDPFIFRMFDLTEYDLVVVSAAGTYSGINSFKKGTNTLHICYCHTPPRYLYGYATANKWTSNPLRRFLLLLGNIPMHFIRMQNFTDAQKPDFFIANSEEIVRRIKKFYRRDAVVIHPPIDIPKIKNPANPEDRTYFLTGGRLARAKRFDLAVEACTKLNLPLKVFGREFAGYGKELKEMAGPTIEFLGEVSQAKKWELIRFAKAYISPSLQEDFGMLNLEVNAGGTPVIAYKSGGVLETLVEGKTGIFFDEPTADSVIDAIKKFEKMDFDPEECLTQAKKFSKEAFKDKIISFCTDKLS